MRVPELLINDKQELLEMVKEVCIALTGKAPPEAVALLMETAAAESAFNTRIQLGGGPARGLWQVEPNTAADIFDNYLASRFALRFGLMEISFGFGVYEHLMYKDALSDLLERNDVFCCCMARIVYLRDPDPIPYSIVERAAYWKRVYNTPLGKGTAEHYLATARALALGEV